MKGFQEKSCKIDWIWERTGFCSPGGYRRCMERGSLLRMPQRSSAYVISASYGQEDFKCTAMTQCAVQFHTPSMGPGHRLDYG
jgi:hypothetical protein